MYRYLHWDLDPAVNAGSATHALAYDAEGRSVPSGRTTHRAYPISSCQNAAGSICPQGQRGDDGGVTSVLLPRAHLAAREAWL